MKSNARWLTQRPRASWEPCARIPCHCPASVEAAEGFVMPLQCRHCEDAPCVTVCPSEALKKLGPEQPVIFEEVRRLERWHTTVELACCPACGERFAPARQVASIAEKDVPAEDWLYLCPQCRRKPLGRNLTWARAGKAGR